MRFVHFLRLILLPAMLLLLGSLGDTYSQVHVEVSSERVVIQGKTFYIHTVEPGQTPFSISKAYSISLEDLYKENPDAVEGIKVGQVLRIPYIVPEVQMEKDHEKYLYHTIAAGETLFSLSRRYDVSVSAILEVNPGIDPSDIPIGYELAVPKKEFKTEQVNISPEDEEFTLYRVDRGETLSDIARKFGLTVRDIRQVNRGLIFARVGNLIRIPGKFEGIEGTMVPVTDSDKDTLAITQWLSDTLVAEDYDTTDFEVMPVTKTDISMLRGKVDIAVMLPLFLDENSTRIVVDTTGTQRRELRERPFEWMAPGTEMFLEMYQGILIAANDLRNAGLDVNVHLFETRTDITAPDVIDEIIESGRLRHMDLIIGPIHSFNLEKIAPYASMYNIPVISPVPVRNFRLLEDNPTLFMANPTLGTIQNVLARSISDHYESNFVFVYTDTSDVNNEAFAFRDAIIREVNYKSPTDMTSLKQVLYRSKALSGLDSISSLSHSLSPTKHNVVILGTDQEAALKETLMELSRLARHYPMTIYSYPEVRGLEATPDLSYLFDLEVRIFSPFYIDYSREMVNDFLSKFRTLYFTEPTEQSYAWVCYDVTNYFVSGLAMHGEKFLRTPGIHNPELLHSGFDFRRDYRQNGFENRGLFKLHYTRNYELILVEEDTQIFYDRQVDRDITQSSSEKRR